MAPRRCRQVANVGDSRAIVLRRAAAGGGLTAVALTEDQKADSPAEQARIEAAGGTVVPGAPDGTEPARVECGGTGLGSAATLQSTALP